MLLLPTQAALPLRRAGAMRVLALRRASSSDAAAASTASPSSPLAVYESRLASGQLTTDEHQRRVVERFEALAAKVAQFQPQPLQSSLSSSLLGSRLFGGLAVGRKTLPDRSKAPEGLYLWGTVGGGKTMLMDLFYECCVCCAGDEDRKARTHYNDFMQEVHELLHKAKAAAPPRDVSRWDTYQRFDPIPPVGDAILKKAHLICLDEFQVSCKDYPFLPDI